ncbi:MAG: hypothetical protein RIS44_1424 [Pseudomonadota bacterium]
MPARPVIAPQFQHFVDDELSRSSALIDAIATGTVEQLRQPREGMLSPQERQHYFELIDHLRQRHGLLRDGFVDTLAQLVRGDLQESHSGVHSAATLDFGDFGGTLTLMDEGQVEADIEISRAALLIDGTAEWELRELQSFTSTLNGQQHVTPESNPFRPVFYARALWHGACAVTSAPVQRSIFLRLASGVASGLLKKSWAAASSRIEAMGITPGMYRTVVLTASSTGGSRSAPKGGVGSSNSTEAALPSLPEVPATLGSAREQLNLRRRPNKGDLPPNNELGLPDLPRSGFTPGPGFEQALLRLEQLLAQLPAQAISGALHSELAAPRLRDHLQSLTAATTDRSDQQIIELMARFFDVALSDTEVHAACRPLLTKLQSSALQVALDDPQMLADHQHAVWLFMDQLSEAFALYFHPGDPRLAALKAFADELVQEIANSSTQDMWLYRRALTRLNSHLQSAREAELSAAQSHVDELLLVEKRDHLQRQISQRLVDQMVTLRVSPGVRRFVSGEWAKVLAHAILRHGEQSETTVSYMKAVDDLLWSVNPPNHPQSRQRLLHLLPTLLHRLRSGMSLISLPDSEQEQIMNELMTLHTEALRPGHKSGGGGVVGLAPTSAATPEQIVQMMRDEPAPTEQLGPSFADSLIELASMDTVPAELLETHPPGEDSDFSSPVDAMRVGERIRLFLRGRWSRVQLLWRSPKGGYFLFAGEAPGRTHSITQAALERLSGEKLLLPLEQQRLSQRALKAVIHELV